MEEGKSLFHPFFICGVAMSETIDAKLARLATQVEFLIEEARDAKDARKKNYELMDDLKTRVGNVESFIVTASPTLEEVIVIKHKVIGAGMVGKWAWIVGAFIIGSLFSMREWLAKLL